MTTSASFLPNQDSYTYKEHYLRIENSQGETLLTKTFDTQQALEDEFDDHISKSKKPYSFFSRTVFPVQSNDTTNFLKSFFTPNTPALTSSLTNRVAKIVLGILPFIFDLMTLPIRLITAIPYTLYNNYFNKEEDHKIIQMIGNKPEALHALSEGKVFIRKVTEDFPLIQSGIENGTPCYNIDGQVLTGEGADIYIKRTLSGSGDIKKVMGMSKGWKCTVTPDEVSRYHAFNKT